MYCRMCGNKLEDADHYCRFCGAPTRNQEQPAAPAEKTEVEEEIVFNPPYENKSYFAGKESLIPEEEPSTPEKSEEDLKAFISENEVEEEQNPQEKNDVRGETKENPEFTWNVYEFPTEPKKTEDIVFNWNMDEFGKPEQKAPEESIFEEELFQEIRDDSNRIKEQNIDRFFTFSRKNEEFQELLDKEYEKFKARTEPGMEPVISHKVSPMEPQVKVIRESGIPEAVPLQEIHIDSFIPDAEVALSPENQADAGISQETERLTGEDLFETTPQPESKEEIPEPIEEEILEPAEAESTEPEEEKETPQPEPIEEETPEPDTGHLSEMARARALFFGEELIRDNESIRKKLVPESSEGISAGEESADETAADETTANETAANETAADEKKEDGDTSAEEGSVEAERLPAVSAIENAEKETTFETIEAEEAEETDETDETLKTIETEETEEKPRRSIGQILLAIIAVILVVEIVILGIRYIAPDSAASKAIGNAQVGIFKTVSGWFDGGDNQQSGDESDGEAVPDENDQDSMTEEEQPAPEQPSDGGTKSTVPDPNPIADKNALVSSQMGNNINIAEVKANEALAWQAGKNYGLSDINDSKPITNNIWQTPETGDPVYYDQSIVATIIAFDSQWIDYVNGGSKSVLDLLKKDSEAYRKSVSYSKIGKIKEDFKLLEIGEIRQGSKGFYVWVHEEIQITENGTSTDMKYNWIYYLEPADGKMQIVNYYKLK